MTQQKLDVLESFSFTLESIKYAEAERNYQLNKTAGLITTATLTTPGARGTHTHTDSDTTANATAAKSNCINHTINVTESTPIIPIPTATATTTSVAAAPPATATISAAPQPPAPTTTTAAIESSFESLSQQIAKARLQIQQSLKDYNITLTPTTNNSTSFSCPSCSGGVKVDPAEEEAMRVENELLKKKIELLEGQVKQLTDRVSKLELGGSTTGTCTVPAPAKAASGDSKKEEDDDVDLFGSDDEEEDAEAAKIKEARLAEYAAKKSKKAAVIAKSNVILDVKPWDDETDMKELEKHVRSIVMDGLLWGSSKLVEIAFGVKKLQIATVIEDDKVSVEELQEKLEAFEDFVQSVDIAAFNKI